jgi:hypothetical protein
MKPKAGRFAQLHLCNSLPPIFGQERVMELIAEVGALIDPKDPESPRVVEVLIHTASHGFDDVIIVRANSGEWFADYEGSLGVMSATSAEELAVELWFDGECPTWVAEAMFRIGWLTLDHATLKRVDHGGWRHPDPWGCFEEPASPISRE